MTRIAFGPLAAAALGLMVLGGCATQQTAYAPQGQTGDYGYTENRLSEQRYRVTFKGNRSTSQTTVKDYALLRAAELTLAEGYDWFEIVDRTTDKDEIERHSGGSAVTTSYGRRTETRCGLITCQQTTTPTRTTSVSATPSRKIVETFTASMEILMGTGRNRDAAQVYNAQEVAQNLGPLTR